MVWKVLETEQHGKSRLFKARAKRWLVLTLRGRKYSERNSLGFANGFQTNILRTDSSQSTRQAP